jgi:hypothetical protein
MIYPLPWTYLGYKWEPGTRARSRLAHPGRALFGRTSAPHPRGIQVLYRFLRFRLTAHCDKAVWQIGFC